jgi:hypothetical protein
MRRFKATLLAKPARYQQPRFSCTRSVNAPIRSGQPEVVSRSCLAVALGREAIRQNYSVQFVTAATLVATLAKVHADGALEKQLTILGRPKLLIIDELGYLRAGRRASVLPARVTSIRARLDPDHIEQIRRRVGRRVWRPRGRNRDPGPPSPSLDGHHHPRR